jgi:hypothetical protein
MNNKELTKKNTDVSKTIFLSLYYVFACCYLPLSLLLGINENILSALSLVLSILSIIALTYAAGTFKGVFGYAMTIIILMMFGARLLPVAVLASFASAACVYAYLLLRLPSPLLYGIPAIAPIIVCLVTKDPRSIILALATVPCSLLLTYSIKKELPRVRAICHIGFGTCTTVVALMLTLVYSLYGSISLDTVRLFIAQIKTQSTIILSSAVAQVSEALQNTSLDLSQYADAAIRTVFNLLPAIIIVLASVVSYFLHSMLLSLCFATDEEHKKAIPMLTFDMSFASAAIFIVSLILSFTLATPKTAFYGAIAENLMLVLTPGLILTALGALRMLTTRKGPSCLGSIIYFIVIFMLCSLSLPAIIICSVFGAVVVILAHIAKWRSEQK